MTPLTIRVDDEILLRRPTSDDARQLFDMFNANREHLSRWDGPWLDKIKTVADQRRIIADHLKPGAEDLDLFLLIIYRGMLVGTVSARGLGSTDKSGHLGFGLSATAQGRGIMTRSLRALLDYAFRERGMKRMHLHAATGNLRSRAVASRLGFTFMGVDRRSLLVRGRYIDKALYTMLGQDWLRRRARETAQRRAQA
ncbi:MAG: GNAT family N-acetyltransferase [Chloroflexi bacterium]|nr:GNAT family N-acetyltransferase [Chloroflexota bacterium]